MGRAIITTDSVGARETVRVGQNGILVPPQDVQAVVEAMECYLRDPSLVIRHGAESRRLAEEVFDVRLVNRQIMREMGLPLHHGRELSPHLPALAACPAS